MSNTTAMAIRTVRLDDETEKVLEEIRKETGLPISEALKRGLRSFRDETRRESVRAAYDIYKDLDLGPGGYAISSSADVKRGVREVLRKKHRR